MILVLALFGCCIGVGVNVDVVVFPVVTYSFRSLSTVIMRWNYDSSVGSGGYFISVQQDGKSGRKRPKLVLSV